MDLDLVAGIAVARPDWQIVMIGPVVTIDPAMLPKAPNIHYLGAKQYEELPSYVGGWDVALLPFARNESTRFISPTKTPEYMAAGRPVVSTSIRDVVRPYGELGLVRIADDVPSFVAACEAALAEDAEARIARFDRHLATMSWDSTWARVTGMLDGAVRANMLQTRIGLQPMHPARSNARSAGA
jgi:UDP-galactopyranose mutase